VLRSLTAAHSGGCWNSSSARYGFLWLQPIEVELFAAAFELPERSRFLTQRTRRASVRTLANSEPKLCLFAGHSCHPGDNERRTTARFRPEAGYREIEDFEEAVYVEPCQSPLVRPANLRSGPC
jgi:hypothetical protein